MATSSHETKASLRKTVKQELSALPYEAISSQSQNAQDIVLSLPQYRDAQRISVYLAMPSGEARTDTIVKDALGSGKQVFVPYIYSRHEASSSGGGGEGYKPAKRAKVMDMLRLRSAEEYDGLSRDSWGIPHLSHEKIEERENAMGGVGLSFTGDSKESAREPSQAYGEDGGTLDLIVVPGVAFDSDLNRLGHGAGFYDSYFTRSCTEDERKRPFLVGLCLAEQVLPTGRIAMQEWDRRVDVVAVGDGRLLT